MARSIGIDPGDRVVNVVELDGSYRKTRLLNASSSTIGSGDDPMRPDIIADAVREALDSGMKGELTLGHPCREAVLRTIELPFKGADAIKKVVKSEIETEIFTHSVDEMVVDFHELAELPSGGTKLLVASVPKLGLRNQLNSLASQNVDPERVDLDTMALWRVADWAGAFEMDDDDDDTAEPVHAVVDLCSRSVKVILTEGDQLVEMRVLRFGDSVAAEQIARAHNLDSEQARLTIGECLRTGTDVYVDSIASVPALLEESGEADEATDDADGDVTAAPEAGAVVSSSSTELVTYAEVDAANTKYLQRLARELTRFLTASGMASRVRSVWMSGAASHGNGVAEVLEAVFGYAPQELDVLSRMSHDLDDDEAAERSPGMAIAVGLALGRMGGPEGFSLRQEDLAQTGGFDRIKFPLAIACMVALLAMFVFANQKSMKLKVLELEIGQTFHDPKRPKAAIFHGQLNTLFQGKWFQDKSYFGITKGQSKSISYSYKDLVEDLKTTPVANRVRLVRDKLRQVAAQKQKASGVYEDIALESGLAVLVRWSEVIKSIEPELGRYLVASVDLDMKSQKLSFTMALRGEDFRARQSGVERAFQLEIEKPDSPFQRPEQGGQVTQFAGTATPFADYSELQVAGAHIAFVLDIKESFQPFGPSARIGALLDSKLQPQRDYLAMNHTPAARTEEEVR